MLSIRAFGGFLADQGSHPAEIGLDYFGILLNVLRATFGYFNAMLQMGIFDY